MTRLSGQWCEAPRSVYVAHEIAPQLTAVLGSLVERARVGATYQNGNAIGPMAFEARRDELVRQRDWLKAHGHAIHLGAVIPIEGWFFAPTVLVWTVIEPRWEVFGPLMTVEPVDSDDKAIGRANR